MSGDRRVRDARTIFFVALWMLGTQLVFFVLDVWWVNLFVSLASMITIAAAGIYGTWAGWVSTGKSLWPFKFCGCMLATVVVMMGMASFILLPVHGDVLSFDFDFGSFFVGNAVLAGGFIGFFSKVAQVLYRSIRKSMDTAYSFVGNIEE